MIYQKYSESKEKMIFYPDRGYIRYYGDFRKRSTGFQKIRYFNDNLIQREINKHRKNSKSLP